MLTAAIANNMTALLTGALMILPDCVVPVLDAEGAVLDEDAVEVPLPTSFVH